MTMEWQDIKTAPKDRSFWGWHIDWFEPEICRWDKSSLGFVSRSYVEAMKDKGFWKGYPPTHWKPRTDVPEPPAQSDEAPSDG
jgi:hypothetical protein